jgi:hypothetical protein
VLFNMSGTWEGKVLGILGFTRSSLGFEALSTGAPVLFTQEADLSLEMTMADRWFLRANFLDGYDMNTYQAGYRGKPGEAVQYLGLGNTGLDFPSFPYLDLGGDSPSSIGVYGRFGGGNLQFHGLFRYDLSSREELVFVGNRERRYIWLGLDSMERGRSFVLPDEALDGPPELYVEDPLGDLRDSRGKRWRKLGSGEYGAGAFQGLVELGAAPKTMVAVSYSKKGYPRPWETSLGRYDDPDPLTGGSRPFTGSLFLGEVSGAFGAAVDLGLWPQPGENPAAPRQPGGERLSNGADILIIWEAGVFSPFERMNRYRSPSSALGSAALLRLSSDGERIPGYEILPLEENALSMELPLPGEEAALARNTWELRPEDLGSNRRGPRSRWPLLAAGFSELYLPGRGPFNADMGLRFTGYGGAGDLTLGEDVIPGSIKVYRGGLEDGRFHYDEAAGRVVLENPPLAGEVIRITYLKRSQDGRLGSIAAGLGTSYQGERVGAQAALGLRWNLGSVSYSETGSGSPGTVGLGAQVSWDQGDLSARLRGGFGFDMADTTGLYRAAGMEGGEHTLDLRPEDSYLSPVPGGLEAPAFPVTLSLANRAALVYRNYRENQLGGPVLRSSDWAGAPVVEGKSGPYPVRDSRLSAQTLAAEFSFDGSTEWTGFQVPLEGTNLEGAKLVEVPFRLDGFDGPTASSFSPVPPPAPGTGHGGDFTVIVQFGALQGRDQGFTEYPTVLVEKQIYPQPGAVNPNNPGAYGEGGRIALVQFNEEDRRKLRGANSMRVAVLKRPGLSRSPAGRVMVGPPIVHGAAFRAVTLSGGKISAAADPASSAAGPAAAAVERMETGANTLEAAYGDLIRRLHPGGGQRILELYWDNLDTDMAVGADGRVPALPLSAYRTLSFFVRAPAFSPPAGTVLRFFLAGGPESRSGGPWEDALRGEESILEAELPLSALPPSSWSKVELRYGGGESLRVNGRAAGRLRYRPDRDLSGAAGEEALPSGYLLFLLDTPGGRVPGGNMAIDEIILEDPVSYYRAAGGAAVRWERKGTLVSLRGVPAIEDLSLSTAMETGVRFPAQGELPGAASIQSRSSGESTILGTRVSVNLGFSGTSGGGAAAGDWDAGHGISRSFGPLTLGESFSFNPAGGSLDHRFSVELSELAPLSLSSGGELSYLDESRFRRWAFSLALEELPWLPRFELETGTAWTGRESWAMDNYGEGWARSWALLAPDSGEGEQARNTRGSLRVSKELAVLGFILLLEGDSAVSVPQDLTRSESRVRLDIPLKLGTRRLGFRGQREFLRGIRTAGNNSGGDAKRFGEALRDAGPLWFSVPFYVLGDRSLPAKMAESAKKAGGLHEYSRFRDSFTLSLGLPPRSSLASLWVPRESSLTLGRTAERKMDTPADLLDLNGSLVFSGANLLGAWGLKPVFPFYAGDEFDHILAAALAFPRDDAFSWRLGSTARLGFYGFSGGDLNLANSLTMGRRNRSEGNAFNWVESLELQWTRPSKRGLLKALWDYGMAALGRRSSWLVLAGIPESPYESQIRERLALILDRNGDYLKFSVTIGRESHIVITGRLDLSVFGELGTAWDGETRALSLFFSLGTGLKVSF